MVMMLFQIEFQQLCTSKVDLGMCMQYADVIAFRLNLLGPECKRTHYVATIVMSNKIIGENIVCTKHMTSAHQHGDEIFEPLDETNVKRPTTMVFMVRHKDCISGVRMHR